MVADTANLILAICAIAALVISAVSVAVSVWVARSTSQDMDRSAGAMEKSAAAAEDSAASARAAVDQQGRIADTLDAWATRSDEQQVDLDRLLGRDVSWTIRHTTGSRYELTNEGSVAAYNVSVRSDNAVRFDGPDPVGTWAAGSSEELFVLGSWQTGHPDVVVRWSKTPFDPETQEWHRAIPPRY